MLSGESEYPCLVPKFKEKAFGLAPLNMLVMYFIDSPYCLKIFSSIPSLLGVFLTN